MFRILIIVSMLAAASGVMSASDAFFKEVIFPDYDEKGKLVSLMKSKTAVYKGKLIGLEGVSIDLFGKNLMNIKSPGCDYNSKTKIAVSKENIFIADREMKISGKGYHLDMNTELIQIFSNLEIELEKSTIGEDK
jgi:lipopolysaccharide assembly outer membrane protein LptD (OstA)